MNKTLLATLTAVVFVAATSEPAAAASGKIDCTVEPLVFQMPPEGQSVESTRQNVFAVWLTVGFTNLDCPGLPLMGIDVWEHAIVTFPPGGGPLKGRVELRFMLANGLLIDWGDGQVDGAAVCEDRLCALDMRIRSNGRLGAKLMLHQRGLLVGNDFGDALQSLEIRSGFIDNIFFDRL